MSIQDILIGFLGFLNGVLIPLLFSIAILFIIWNLFRFFIWKGATEEGQDQGKRLIIYGVAALVLMVSLWGIVRIGLQAFGVTRSSPPCPDFMPGCYGGYGSGSAGSSANGTERVFDVLNPGAGIQNRPMNDN